MNDFVVGTFVKRLPTFHTYSNRLQTEENSHFIGIFSSRDKAITPANPLSQHDRQQTVDPHLHLLCNAVFSYNTIIHFQRNNPHNPLIYNYLRNPLHDFSLYFYNILYI